MEVDKMTIVKEGEESLLHSTAVNMKTYLLTGEAVGEYVDEIDNEGVLSSETQVYSPKGILKGAPPGWKPPGPPDKWAGYIKRHNAPDKRREGH